MFLFTYATCTTQAFEFILLVWMINMDAMGGLWIHREKNKLGFEFFVQLSDKSINKTDYIISQVI